MHGMTGTDLVPIPLDPTDSAGTAESERLVRRHFWAKVRTTLGRLPFIEDLLAAWYCFADDRTPPRAKAILVGALAYFVIPTDVLPDFIVGLGFTDDATVLLAAIQSIRGHLLPEHYEKAREALKDGTPPPAG